MTDDPAEPFYAAIRAAPEYDLPRLVFADWLDEHGQPERAEYIRLTCAIEREPNGEQKRNWQARAEQLLRDHRGQWFGPLLGEFRQHRLDRGFLTSIAGDVPRLDSAADALDRFAPCLERLGVAYTRQDAGIVLSLPVVGRLTHLLLHDVSPVSLLSLSAHQVLSGLQELFLGTEGLANAREGNQFVNWNLVQAVPAVRLSTGFGRINEPTADSVNVAETLAFLDRLQMNNLIAFRLWGVVEPVARALALWPGLHRLTELNLHGCCVSAEALPHLLDPLPQNRLEVIRLGNNAISNESAEQIARTPLPPSLKELRLDRNRIGDRGVEALIASPHLKSDVILHIGNNTFSGRSAARLRERFPNVRF